MLKKYGQPIVYKIIDPFINALIRAKVTPNMITTFGLFLNFVAAGIFIYGAENGSRYDHTYVGYAGVMILIAGVFDMVDGQLARKGNMSTVFGALYDSVLDRYSEMVMFLGICYYLVSHDYFLSSLIGFVGMIGSVMVSYTRARAEGLGVNASVGIMQRPQRIVLIGLSAIICGIVSATLGGGFKMRVDWFPIPLFETITFFTLPLLILAVMANQTAIERLTHSRKVLEEKNEEEKEKYLTP